MTPTPVLLYRGPLERSRLALVVDAMTEAFRTPAAFRWLVPPPLDVDSEEVADRLRLFLDAHDGQFATHSVHDGRLRSLPSATRELRGLVDRGAPIVGFQFTAIFYVRLLRRGHPFCWVINGLPEQRLLEPALRDHPAVKAQWAAARLGPKPQLTLVTTEAMGRLTSERLGGLDWIAVPSSTDLAEFSPKVELPRSYLTFVGTDAPWQGLDLLAAVWRELARRDPDLRFRIVSREPGVRVVRDSVPRTDIRSVAEPADVAPLLWEAEAGFLLRSPSLISSTTTQIKFAEYVAAGVPVVATDIGWETGDVIRRTGCGMLVPYTATPAEMADAYLEFRTEGLEQARRACREAVKLRDRAVGVQRFAAALQRAGVAMPAARPGATG
ncbi:MAG: glycosyltransferase [Acidimicrobiia bacterium]